jgi:phosphate transport system substrate-binding protein
MAREMRKPVESMAFAWAHHYPAFSVDIANAGLRADRPSANLAIFVNRDNPLSKLTLAQLASILGGEQKHGRGNIRTWGELGLGGDWKDRPIHVYGPAVDSISALFVRSAVLHDSYKWNPGYRELTGTGPEILAVLAHDPAGITYAPLRGSNDSVKPLELAASEDGPFFALTEQNAAARTYPLTRVVTMVLRRPPGKPIDPQVKEFLRYILSRDGQAAIVHDAAYLPLNAAQAQQQLEKLD